MSQLNQALLALGFILAVFLAGYGFRAALSRLRRLRGSRRGRHGRLFYAGRRAPPDPGRLAPPATIDVHRIEADIKRLGEHVDRLRALYGEQQAMSSAARSDLSKATDYFRASVEQTQALTKTLSERLEVAERLQLDFEEMVARLGKPGKDGPPEAVVPFKARRRRVTEQK